MSVTFRRMKHKWLFLLLFAPILLALILFLTDPPAGIDQSAAAEPLPPLNQQDAPLTVLARQADSYEYLGTETDIAAAQTHGADTVAFAAALEELGIEFVYLQAPHKTGRNRAEITDELSLGNHAAADAFLEILDAAEITAVDLRDIVETMPPEESFFRTDHHWTPEAAFRSFQSIAPLLAEEYGMAFTPEMMDPGSYEIQVIKNAFRGAQGIAAGEMNLDSISMWRPKFETRFSYTAPYHGIDRSGSFDETLLFPERIGVEEELNINPYTLWSGGDYTMARIQNQLCDNDLTVFVLRDSFGCTLTPFLALGAEELVTFDLRNFENSDSIMEYVSWLKPDLVIMLYTTSSTQNPGCFAALRDD